MKRILVIDDEITILVMLRRLLTKGGYEVMEAANGKIAADLLRDNPADLIITDLIMPDQEGLETIIEFRRDYPAMPIIAMSGGGSVGPSTYLDIAKKLGARRTFTKPFHPADLLAAVHEILKEKETLSATE